MRCAKIIYFARMSNTVLLGMGGYSFGFEIGDNFNTNPIATGFVFALLFLFNSIYVRRKCEDAGYPR